MTDDIKKEIISVAKGTCVLVGVSLLISLLIGKLDFSLFLGFIIGGINAIFNFYLLALAAIKCVAEAHKNAHRFMASRYFMRMAITTLVIIIGLYADFINCIGIIIPLVFPKLTLYYSKILRKEE